jgi:hypothetical protein
MRELHLADLVVAVGLLILALSLWAPATGSAAYHQYSSDWGDPDPCARDGIGDEGGILRKTYKDPSDPKKSNAIILQCSPLLKSPAGLINANDLVGRENQDRVGPPYLRGGLSFDQAPIAWRNTACCKWIHGDVAEALRLQTFQAVPAIIDAAIAAGAGLTTALVVSGIVCAAGGIPTLGIACAGAAAALGGAFVSAVTTAVGSVLKDFVTAQYNRIKAMGDADWFMWSNTVVTWNSFGDISDTSINPSFLDANPNPAHTDYVRIGVQFSDAPVGAGPDFFNLPYGSASSSGSPRAAAASPDAAASARRCKKKAKKCRRKNLGKQISSLNFNVGPAGLNPRGRDRVRTGDSHTNVLRGAGGEDTLQALGHRDRVSGRGGDDHINGGGGSDIISGGAGRDMLFARRGSDRVRGGPGHDVLIGGSGSDTLRGGPVSDWLFDDSGPTLAFTGGGGGSGSGIDRVNVRDGRADDTVICDDSRSSVVIDSGDLVLGDCGKVIRRGNIHAGMHKDNPTLEQHKDNPTE